MPAPFNVTILGAAGAYPIAGKFPSSQVIQINQNLFLIDAGEGTQFQLLKLGISLNRISHIFISHLHGDHYLGLMGLLFTMHLSGRKQDIIIYSHAGLDEIILIQLKHADSVLSYKIIFRILTIDKTELILDMPELTVHTIPLKHRVPCSGFLFKEKPGPYRIIKEKIPKSIRIQDLVKLKSGQHVVDEKGDLLYDLDTYTFPPHPIRSYAYCSDTAPNEKIIECISGCDLLYHEATFSHAENSRASDTYHSTAVQAGQIAKKANVKRLMIGHFSARYKNFEPLLEEAKTVFANTIIASEGLTIALPAE